MFYVRNLFNTRKKDIWVVLIFEIFSMILIHFLLKVSNWGHFRWLPCPSTMTFSIITLCERFLCPKDIFYLPRVLLNQNYLPSFTSRWISLLFCLNSKRSIQQLLINYSLNIAEAHSRHTCVTLFLFCQCTKVLCAFVNNVNICLEAFAFNF